MRASASLRAFDPASVRAQFASLSREQDGRPVVYFDGPAGTQVPESVIEAEPAVVSPVVGALELVVVVDVVGVVPLEPSVLLSEADPVVVPESGLQPSASAVTRARVRGREGRSADRPKEFMRPG